MQGVDVLRSIWQNVCDSSSWKKNHKTEKLEMDPFQVQFQNTSMCQ